MMDPELLQKLMIGVCVLEYAVLIAYCVRRLSFRSSMAPVFFTFALVSNLMSSLYWLAFALLRPETRMPFAANEFGEIGAFLLLASSLNAVFRGHFAAARKTVVCAAFFAAASTALWIGWSGEWVEDMLIGFSFGYFLCVCVRSLKQSNALFRVEWRVLGVLALLLLLLQGLTFVLPEPWRSVADYGAYAVMFSVLFYGLGKLFRTLRRGLDAAAQFALAVACFAWSLSTMYMSAGNFYLAAVLIYYCCAPLMLITLRREEAAA